MRATHSEYKNLVVLLLAITARQMENHNGNAEAAYYIHAFVCTHTCIGQKVFAAHIQLPFEAKIKFVAKTQKPRGSACGCLLTPDCFLPTYLMLTAGCWNIWNDDDATLIFGIDLRPRDEYDVDR
jgi:hypothetical protein